MARKAIQNPEVAAVFDRYPPKPRRKLLALRTLLLQVARLEDVGEIEETLKWGQPAYLTSQSKSGSTIRMGWSEKEPTVFSLYFHCQTNLVSTFREMFPDEFEFEGNRRVVFQQDGPLPKEAIKVCLAKALTYHRAKSSRRP